MNRISGGFVAALGGRGGEGGGRAAMMRSGRVSVANAAATGGASR